MTPALAQRAAVVRLFFFSDLSANTWTSTPPKLVTPNPGSATA
jgi:hypothetical protein